MDKHKKILRILYIIGYCITAIMLVITILFKDYKFQFENTSFSTLYINIPTTCILSFVSTIFVFLLLKKNKTNIRYNVVFKKTYDLNELKLKQQNKLLLIKKILIVILYVLSSLLITTDLILINIPLTNILLIPLEISLLILSIISYIIAKKLQQSSYYNQIINLIKNQNRE